MSKSKYNTIKELPFAWYEVDALEAWLDEQSRQGLKMVDFFGFDFGRRRAVFMETNELPTRYRIHIKPKDGYYTRREEYKETMRELGWEYVGPTALPGGYLPGRAARRGGDQHRRKRSAGVHQSRQPG